MNNREAIALLRNLEDALDSYCELNEEGKTAFRMAIESLELFGNSEHLPSAQPKTGKWITVHGYCTPGGDPVWACSECGKGRHVYGIEHGSYGRDVSDGQWKACPNCGARMKEGE